jgi:hypothetical protein
VIVVYHICTIGDYQPIVDRQIELISKLDNPYLLVMVVGPGTVKLPSWVDRVHYIQDEHTYEIKSINRLKMLSDMKNNNTPVLYINSRGVSHTGDKRYFIDKWSDILEYFCLTHYTKCLNLLDTYDTVSALHFEKPVPHYSGNIWWANSGYIKTLPYLSPETTIYKQFKPELEGKEKEIGIARHDCEFWILRNPNVRHYSFFNTSKCLYYEEEDESSYKIFN